MSVGSIQSAMVSFALFDAWMSGMKKLDAANNVPASPLVNAAFQAFEGYLNTVQMQNTAMIAGVSAQLGIYGLNAQGNGALPITNNELAPLLALNVMA
jgi:hypothetical protein